MKSSPSRNTGFFPVASFTLSAALLLLASPTPVRAEPGNDHRAPDVPAALQVPDGNKVEFHAYAVGVQIYIWTVTPTGSSWVFKAPEAVLFKKEKDAFKEHHVVGLHYAGPTWEHKDGSKVVGARLASAPSPDPNAIPWLLLRGGSHEGDGKFSDVTYIQRVNTVGGKVPAASGTLAGQEARVPYTADYYFYRANH